MNEFYGTFSDAGLQQDYPAITMSADPEHMVETVGHGFPVSLAVVPNMTQNLRQIDETTDTDVAAFNRVLRDVSGKEYFVQMSEKGLARRASGQRKRADEVGERPFDFLASEFSKDISDSVEAVTREYGSALFFPYMNSAPVESFVADFDNLDLVAPELEVMRDWDSKTWTYDRLQAADVNLIPGETFQRLEDAKEYLEGKEWDAGAFVSRERGASGSGSAHIHSPEDVGEVYNAEGDLLIQKWLEGIEAAPNVLMMVGESESTALISSDQIIESGTDYSGNSYPLNLDESTIEDIENQAEIIGEQMRRDGYRGLTGVDMVVDDGQPYYVEVNPRKNHSTVVKTAMLEKIRPDGIPPLPVVEKQTVLEGESHDLREWNENVHESDLSWDMYLLKAPGWIKASDLGPSGFHDHDYDFGSQFVANVPEKGVMIPRSYEGSKSSGRTEQLEEIELGRLVSTGPNERRNLTEEYREGFDFLGDES